MAPFYAGRCLCQADGAWVIVVEKLLGAMAIAAKRGLRMSLESLEKRIRVLEDIEEIRKLKARYAAACDINAEPGSVYSAREIASLFTEDAVFDPGVMGKVVRGRKAIQEVFTGSTHWMSFAVHLVNNPIIDVDGDRAKGTWYLFQAATFIKGDRAVWGSGRYDEEYARVDGQWKISSWKLTSFFWTPFDEGWARTQFADR
jgi:ketosteroid isomerase-like protein